jgi:hypothetical protein
MQRQCSILAVLAVLQGCYTYAPLETGVPPVGENIEFRINDQGRFELGDRLGRGLAAVEGRLTGTTDDQYLVNVAAISFLNGEKNRWSGEPMRLNRAHVGESAIRRLDKRRSWIAAGVTVVALGVFAATRGLLIDFFNLTEEDPGSGTPPVDFRPRIILP